MDTIIYLVLFASILNVSHGSQSESQPTNYELSLSKNGGGGFGLREIWDLLLGGGYGHYPNQGYPSNYPSGPALYPSGPGYPGQYPGGNYPESNYPGPAGPPGAHPGCPLCDSSVYSYCSYKQAHDSCCCDNPAYLPYKCRKSDCKFLYANTCQEYQLISNCCCIDLQKNSIAPVAPVVA